MTSKAQKQQSLVDAPKIPYQPSDREKRGMERVQDLRNVRAPYPSIRMKDAKKGVAEVDHQDLETASQLLMGLLATNKPDFLDGALRQITSLGDARNGGSIEATNFTLSVINAVQPRDELETLLGIQMAAVHMETIKAARRLGLSDTIDQVNCNEKTLNKLARTFTTQLEALKRYRTGGEQKVTVQHVHVSDGGQAVVGFVNNSQTGLIAADGVVPDLPTELARVPGGGR